MDFLDPELSTISGATRFNFATLVPTLFFTG